jgi:hypothetical protein
MLPVLEDSVDVVGKVRTGHWRRLFPLLEFMLALKIASHLRLSDSGRLLMSLSVHCAHLVGIIGLEAYHGANILIVTHRSTTAAASLVAGNLRK